VKLDSLVSDGRHRHIASWRKAMKEEFNRCAQAVLRCDLEDSNYIMDADNWLCTCPHFPTSRFLLCKHLVQACEPVDPLFFLVVPARNRTAPFWRHQLLVPKGGHREPIQPGASALSAVSDLPPVELTTEDLEDEEDLGEDDEEETAPVDYSAPYNQAYIDLRHKLLHLVSVLDHNAPFTDRRFLDTVRARLAGAERLADDFADLQARTDSRSEDLRPSTWGRNGLARLAGFHTLPPEKARELQAQRTSQLRAAGLA
jgi:hypothetical protein